MRWKLNKAMYGARDVAQNCQRERSEAVQALGLTIGMVSPRHSYHSKRNVCRNIYGCDFVFVGSDGHLALIGEHMGGAVKVRIAITGRSNRNQLRMLSRNIRWKQDGILYDSDRRHAGRLVDEVGLMPGRAVVTPQRWVS